MDHHVFRFTTTWQCIKGKQYILQIKTKIGVQNNLAYFPFMHCPLVSNRKTRWSIRYLLGLPPKNFFYETLLERRLSQFDDVIATTTNQFLDERSWELIRGSVAKFLLQTISTTIYQIISFRLM